LADLTDKATDYEEMARDAAVSLARVAAQRLRLPAVGQCHHCGEEVGPQARFCGPECRDDYEFEKRQRARAGKR
jgi:hypothetical protein